ncbi:hypothetical protein Anas_07847 [Armadillidium nasatum]|uniref:Uncharacterized protein n=1 Tax=Armadillidium nasatum TaxID=96803 RepID=A0A5N5TFI1_9CRUS|nr:hypothetical protein Anas_07847 [Armadillidium nasatum]
MLRESSFTISTQWNGKPLKDKEKVKIILKGFEDSSDVLLRIESPFYNNPIPNGTPGQPLFGLWEYEVVEAFFLNKDEEYLEVEIGPYGHHIVLFLKGKRNILRHSYPLKVTSTREGNRWTGEALIPGDYFPPKVSKFNSYAVHNINGQRRYLALYPTDGSTDKVEFHDLRFFKDLDVGAFSPKLNEVKKMSEVWLSALKGAY